MSSHTDPRQPRSDDAGGLGQKAATVQVLLGESAGRVCAPVGSLPSGVIAVTVPVRRDGEVRAPRDRRRRLKIGDVDLISAQPTSAFDPPSDLTTRELMFVLEVGRRDWATIARFFGAHRAWSAAISLVRCGGVILRCRTDETLELGQPTSWRRSHAWSLQHADLLHDLRGRPDPDHLRRELLGMMAQVDQLRAERDLLAACPQGSPLRVPMGSATGAEAWSVYEHAVRAAVVWWLHHPSAAEPLTAKGLASKAFRNSKGWTPERELAFANLAGTKRLSISSARNQGRGCWVIGR